MPMSLLLEQILPLSYMAGRLGTAATVPEGGFVVSDISIIFQPETQQQKLDSDCFLLSLQTLMVGFLQSPPREAGPLQQMVCCVQQLAPLHATRSFSRDRVCEPACVCVCVCRSAHDFQLPFSAFCFSQPKSWEAWHTLQP